MSSLFDLKVTPSDSKNGYAFAAKTEDALATLDDLKERIKDGRIQLLEFKLVHTMSADDFTTKLLSIKMAERQETKEG